MHGARPAGLVKSLFSPRCVVVVLSLISKCIIPFPRFCALISLIDSFALPVSPLHALCVLGPSPRAALRVYVLSTAYHAIKAVSLQRVLKRIAGQNGFALAKIWGGRSFPGIRCRLVSA